MYYIYPLITLIALLILFNLFFIKLFPKNKRFWKKVDYWWVSLGVIGIIGATFNYRKEISSAWRPWHLQSLKAVYNEYTDDLRRQSTEFSDTSGYFIGVSENSIQKRKIAFAGEFLNALSMRLDSCKDLILNDEQYYLIDSVTNPFQTFIDTINDKLIVDVCRPITFMSQRATDEANILKELREQGTRDTLNWMLLILSPYLFAIAIAIRLTKVTAELEEI